MSVCVCINPELTTIVCIWCIKRENLCQILCKTPELQMQSAIKIFAANFTRFLNKRKQKTIQKMSSNCLASTAVINSTITN